MHCACTIQGGPEKVSLAISTECGMELNANDMLHDNVSCTSVASLFENRHHKQLNVVRSLFPLI
jgi:hypothetical protein